MEALKKPDVATNESSGLPNNTGSNYSTLREDTKTHRVLSAFLDLGDKGLNRFEAHRYHDTALNSTISTLANKHGLQFLRESEVVPCVNGTKLCRVTRYWLNQGEREKVERLLGVAA